MPVMIDRVAKAILDATPEDMMAANEINDEKAGIFARAAIAAMREPTDQMCEVGAETCGTWSLIREAWQDMIDAALSETTAHECPPNRPTSPAPRSR